MSTVEFETEFQQMHRRSECLYPYPPVRIAYSKESNALVSWEESWATYDRRAIPKFISSNEFLESQKDPITFIPHGTLHQLATLTAIDLHRSGTTGRFGVFRRFAQVFGEWLKINGGPQTLEVSGFLSFFCKYGKTYGGDYWREERRMSEGMDWGIGSFDLGYRQTCALKYTGDLVKFSPRRVGPLLKLFTEIFPYVGEGDYYRLTHHHPRHNAQELMRVEYTAANGGRKAISGWIPLVIVQFLESLVADGKTRQAVQTRSASTRERIAESNPMQYWLAPLDLVTSGDQREVFRLNTKILRELAGDLYYAAVEDGVCPYGAKVDYFSRMFTNMTASLTTFWIDDTFNMPESLHTYFRPQQERNDSTMPPDYNNDKWSGLKFQRSEEGLLLDREV